MCKPGVNSEGGKGQKLESIDLSVGQKTTTFRIFLWSQELSEWLSLSAFFGQKTIDSI